MARTKDTYVIILLGAIVFLEDGGHVALGKGDTLPDNVSTDERKRLAGLGAIGKVKADTADTSADTTTTTTTEAPAFDILAATTGDLSKHLGTGKDGKPFNATEVVDMAKHDDPAKAAELAEALLKAELDLSGGDGRDTVTGPLGKVIDAGKPAT